VFLGAARTVTGSRYWLEANGVRLLVDCGLYQERQFASRNWDRFPVSPDTLHAVLVTHAHLDHCGLLPKLVREGFRGKLYCTEATAEIIRITLMDSAHIQEEDAAFKKRRHEREGRIGPYPEIPLYTVNDAQACFPLLEPIRYGDHIALGEGISATFHEAGHVLGSSMVTLDISESGDRRRILFSGDIGRWGEPILQDPTVFSQADYILVESTYGDRLHESQGVAIDQLAEAINSTIKAGGNVIVPSFALERSQEVLYYTNKLLLEGRIPRLRVFLDSPMAVSVTEVFKRHPELFDREMTGFVQQGNSPFNFRGLSMVTVVEDSKAISDLVGPRMIIAGSGMCNAGRVKHHLVNNISNPKNAVLFVGYQAVGTLGRQIIDGAKVVRILGQNYQVRAKIVQIQGFSAHADRDELLRWLSSIRKAPDQTFVVHGEEETSFRFADLVRAKLGWGVTVPEYRQEVMLE
ncbi:MAG TPA: MBL fold metallo-hydrolase, partial [Dehalococcoidia bacterium]|nr:MBL fold metallo-hydrolase [Dehalococcoidia bacterium]